MKTLVADSMKTFWLPGEPNFKKGAEDERCVAMGKSPESPGGMWEDVSCLITLPITCEVRFPYSYPRNPRKMEERCQGFALKKGDGSFICQLLSKNSTIAVDPDKTSRVSLPETIAPKEFEFAMVTGKIHFLRAMGKGQYTKARSTCKGEGLAHLVMDDRGQDWHDYVLQFMVSHFPSQDKFWTGGDDIDWNNEHSWVDGEEDYRF
ncbi:unnamed protein product [Darwinula stevensoni]|uniref:C-type lectin domain-containing protein n=1 Tax=Darwinula stevensoni TaxID=69355 RepID=A0A7R9FQG7_9CRUS|nr:unnamed protein product [Darwinula stevensoni]CAG0899483.1 unnamed protein product [Darwinula stevensoni]